jgi:hypothetical protein
MWMALVVAGLVLVCVTVFALKVELPKMAEQDKELSAIEKNHDERESLLKDYKDLVAEGKIFEADLVWARLQRLSRRGEVLMGPIRQRANDRYDYSKRWMPW